MVNYLAKMRRKLALGPFFTVFIGADQRNSIQNTIQVSDYHKTKRELNPFRCKRLPRKLSVCLPAIVQKQTMSRSHIRNCKKLMFYHALNYCLSP